MSGDRNAACSCGQLALVASGEPVRISICHCRACQRRTGSAFGVQARFPEAQVRISGRSSTYVRSAESGNPVTMHFCPDCGSTVYYALDAVPGHIGVPVGAFADPSFPPPSVSVYGEFRHDWVVLPSSIEQLE